MRVQDHYWKHLVFKKICHVTRNNLMLFCSQREHLSVVLPSNHILEIENDEQNKQRTHG